MDTCPLCSEPAASARRPSEASAAEVCCNVRAFADRRFRVARCAGCGSIHAADAISDAELAAYYAAYPYHRQRYDLMTMLFYDVYERRLRRAGVRPEHSILDYGCGSGHLLRFLRWKGFSDLAGYDAHSAAFADPAPLGRRYDCVIAQDLIEHVADPVALLRQLAELLRPGGILIIGTPNADGIDLGRPEDFRHALHQPYHRHLFSQAALRAQTEALGLRERARYLRPYTHTIWPGLNQAFMTYYARCFDDTMDLAFDGLRFHPRLLSPVALFLFFFGYAFGRPTDLMLVLQAPETRADAHAADGERARTAAPARAAAPRAEAAG